MKDGVHTNGLENPRSLLKRTIKGTYVHVEPFHLFRYLDEQTYRFNERRDEKGRPGPFPLNAVKTATGRRLTEEADRQAAQIIVFTFLAPNVPWPHEDLRCSGFWRSGRRSPCLRTATRCHSQERPIRGFGSSLDKKPGSNQSNAPANGLKGLCTLDQPASGGPEQAHQRHRNHQSHICGSRPPRSTSRQHSAQDFEAGECFLREQSFHRGIGRLGALQDADGSHISRHHFRHDHRHGPGHHHYRMETSTSPRMRGPF